MPIWRLFRTVVSKNPGTQSLTEDADSCLHILQAHPGIVVTWCSKRDLSTFLRQIANSTLA
jgi:hypothetical protein